jgi:hypothetical protein
MLSAFHAEFLPDARFFEPGVPRMDARGMRNRCVKTIGQAPDAPIRLKDVSSDAAPVAGLRDGDPARAMLAFGATHVSRLMELGIARRLGIIVAAGALVVGAFRL